MKEKHLRKAQLLLAGASATLLTGLITPSLAAEGAPPIVVAQAGGAAATDDRQILMQRLQQLEQRLNQIEGRPPAAPGAAPANLDTQAILDRLDALDQRIVNLETNTVLSAPKINVKEVEVYVDQNGNQFDQPGPGRTAQTTYQRERVFRRQVVEDEIQEALAKEAENGIELGVSSITTIQGALQTRGPKLGPPDPNGHIYGVTQADITFLAQSAALNTSFFADVVAIGGPTPNGEIPALTLLNSQGARLSNNRLQMREAWIRTEIFGQRLGITLGQVDLTNYFDRNAVANDETTQFISDALVNNQVLGLANNGLGAVAVWDPKTNYNFKIGVQQSEADPTNPIATNLNDSIFSLAEFEYIAVPFGLGEGHYRIWGRLDNSTGVDRAGWGVSIDQHLTPEITLFGRYGNGDVGGTRVHFFDAGFGFQAPLTLNPLDHWGIGYAQTELVQGPNEKLIEGFYNLHLTDHLAVSAMLQYVVESAIRSNFFIPGLRMGVTF
jgi:hypothetical protein